MTQEQIINIVTATMERILATERNRTNGMLQIINDGAIELRRETTRLHDEVRKMVAEPRCPVCGRSNEPRRGV